MHRRNLLRSATIHAGPSRPTHRDKLLRQEKKHQKDGTKIQESHQAAYDKTGRVASNEFRHGGSSNASQENHATRLKFRTREDWDLSHSAGSTTRGYE